MTAYYNEFDKKAAAWLRELIKQGLIAPGEVDERSIKDVKADEIKEYTQVHFFAGIGGWSLALRLAGVPDDARVWTGSCPCQPFSAAGNRKGQADERHLWPEMFRLVRECGPERVFGEQVESAIGHGWLDGVFADLENEGYACGATVLGAHSVGAPHIRQRLYWVADAGHRNNGRERRSKSSGRSEFSGACCRLEHASGDGRNKRRTESIGRGIASGCIDGGMGDTVPRECEREQVPEIKRQNLPDVNGPSGPWSDFLVIPCRDNKARRISTQPGDEPLAYGIPRDMGSSESKLARMAIRTARTNRTLRLRGYGNAIVPQVAAEFIRASIEATEEQ